MSDIDTAAADSLKVLDPERPIREADIEWAGSGTLATPASAQTKPGQPTYHYLPANADTVHWGYFSKLLKPHDADFQDVARFGAADVDGPGAEYTLEARRGRFM